MNDLATMTKKKQAVEARRIELSTLSDELNTTDVGTLRMKHEKAVAASEAIAQELRTVRDELESIKAKQSVKQAPKQETTFPYKNVSVRSQFGTTEMIGEMTNNSDKAYELATFTVSVYDDSGILIDTGNVLMSSFSQGATKSFQCNFLKIEPSQVSEYKIEFENGL